MNNSEDLEMLELCEPDVDDLKSGEEPKDEPKDMTADETPVMKVEPKTEEPVTKMPEDLSTSEMHALYESMGIDLKDPRVVTYVRFDTLHLEGVDEMSTKEVYDFFLPLKPMTLEWINDTACNVVWPGENVAAQAVLTFSVPSDEKMETELVPDSKPKDSLPPNETEKEEIKDKNQIVVVEEDDDDEGSEDGEISDPVSKMSWRKATKGQLKFRFATWDDRKVRGAEKYSEYYKKHGNPNFGGMKGLISGSRKRKLREQPLQQDETETQNPFPREEEEENPLPEIPVEDARLRLSKIASEKSEMKEAVIKRPKMKMYADEEERKSRRPKSNNVSTRLGSITVNVLMEGEEEEEEEEVAQHQQAQQQEIESNDYDDLEYSSLHEFGSRSVWDRLQVEVSNTRHSHKEDRRRSHRSSSRTTNDQPEGNLDLRSKLQRIRDDKKKEHRSPLLVSETSK